MNADVTIYDTISSVYTFEMKPQNKRKRAEKVEKRTKKINIRMNEVEFYHKMKKYVNVVKALFFFLLNLCVSLFFFHLPS